MRLIIAGSRNITNYNLLVECMFNYTLGPTVILSGGARGVDTLGERYWRENRDTIKLERYPAEWGIHGLAAGFIRNHEMANNADALLALWDGKSRGTKDMIDRAIRHGLEVHVKVVGEEVESEREES